mmetsp:Transcript_11526/g.21378  ORF Transcript_11526/g.21378 Transcript_11526/m.21378 type:complete len:518 (-) Transcript_11526:1116-2669(-)
MLNAAVRRHAGTVRQLPASLLFKESFASSASAQRAVSGDGEPKPLSQMDGPGWWNILYQAQAGEDQLKVYEKVYQQYKSAGVAKVKGIKGDTEVYVFNQDDVAHVYLNDGAHPHSPAQDIQGLASFLIKRYGEDSQDSFSHFAFSEKEEVWRHGREIIAGALLSKGIPTYAPLIQEAARNAAPYIEVYEDDMFRFFQLAAFDMFGAAVWGDNAESVMDPKSDNPLKQMVDLDEQSLALDVTVSFAPFFLHPRNAAAKLDEAYGKLYDLAEPIIDRIFDPTKEVKPCFFKDLKEVHGLSRNEIAASVGSLLAAGIGTTAGTMSMLYTALLMHPECQPKIRAEINQVLGKDEPYGQRTKLPYLEAVIRETHRLYPGAAVATMRLLKEDLVLPATGYRIPAGTKVHLCPGYAARDTEINSDASEFNPDKYLKGAKAAAKGCPHQSLYYSRVNKDPFSMGPRSCAGKRVAEIEIRSLFVELLRRYEFVPEAPLSINGMKFKQRTLRVPETVPKCRIIPVQA